MQKLRQYVDLIQQFKVKTQEISAVLGGERTKIHQFFEGLAARRWSDDEGAAVRELYGDAFDTTHAPYRTLKTVLKKKLKNILFLIDFKQSDTLNELQQVRYEAVRTEATIKLLLGRGKTDAAVDLCQHLLDIALKFEITHSVVLASKNLRAHYRFRSPNQKKYEYYHNLYNTYSEYLRLEDLAEYYYYEIVGHFVNNKSTKKWVQPIAQDYLSQLLPYKGKVETTQFVCLLGMVELTTHMIMNDYRATLVVCDEYITKIESKFFEHQATLVVLYHQKTMCHLMLRDYEEAWKSAQKTAKWVIYGTHNWFKDGTVFLQVCLHTGRHQEVVKTFIDVFKHEDFEYQPESVQEELKIYQGYIQWLIAVGKISITETEQKQIGAFRLNRFLNAVPTFSQDKRGLNVPILMLQILWAISQKDYTGFVQRLEAVNKYKTRYLEETPDSRTNLLIKLLSLAPKLNYNAVEIQQKGENLYQTLINIDYDTKDEASEIEVFPYDMYWLYFLEIIIS
jgi:hypothetical protein